MSLGPPATIRTVWITRAEPGATRTAARLDALGFVPIVAPVLVVHALAPTLDLSDVGGLAFTSANGVAAFARIVIGRDLPVFVVGDATAQAASEAGFTTVVSAAGNLSSLATLLQRSVRSKDVVLHPSALVPAGDLATAVGPSVLVRSVPVYETTETDAVVPDTFDAVMAHSPRASHALARLLMSASLTSRVAVAISDAAAAPLARLSFADLRVADRPHETAMIAALGKPGPRV